MEQQNTFEQKNMDSEFEVPIQETSVQIFDPYPNNREIVKVKKKKA